MLNSLNRLKERLFGTAQSKSETQREAAPEELIILDHVPEEYELPEGLLRYGARMDNLQEGVTKQAVSMVKLDDGQIIRADNHPAYRHCLTHDGRVISSTERRIDINHDVCEKMEEISDSTNERDFGIGCNSCSSSACGCGDPFKKSVTEMAEPALAVPTNATPNYAGFSGTCFREAPSDDSRIAAEAKELLAMVTEQTAEAAPKADAAPPALSYGHPYLPFGMSEEEAAENYKLLTKLVMERRRSQLAPSNS